MHRQGPWLVSSEHEDESSPLLALLSCLMVVALTASAHARVPVHATSITSTSAYWQLGPAGNGGIRYGIAGFYEKNQDGDVETFAYMALGVCKRAVEGRRVCTSRHSVTDEDHEPQFFMDPSMQIASLRLGPHRVQWDAGADTPGSPPTAWHASRMMRKRTARGSDVMRWLKGNCSDERSPPGTIGCRSGTSRGAI